MSLTEYIDLHYAGVKADFARAMDVIPQQVTRWINEEWIVVGHILYSPRRAVPENGA
ncbi:hypothetical protein KC222_00175 [Cedecea davisae]|uniref:Uncharacterized protein n=1 Tax=Cedecea davisae TaxID=158484 RepID=A0ABS6DC51_9ENTR|nr:hypothetical protein [Cedecea davisae]MBU4680429.1 hypothetical protein [Cedecea davisae]MBU4684921.1 hypothetical protein [Cedecea davisae]